MKITKKLVLIGLFVSCGVLLGCSKTPDSDVNVLEENTEENFVGTVKDLIKKNKPFVCDVSYTDENGATINGKVYSDGEAKRTRSEMTVNAGNQTIKSFVIQDNNTTYLRSDGSNKGTKMTIKENDNDENNMEDDSGDTTNNGENMNFVCKKWNVEKDLLEVPSSIEFTDFSKELEKYMNK